MANASAAPPSAVWGHMQFSVEDLLRSAEGGRWPEVQFWLRALWWQVYLQLLNNPPSPSRFSLLVTPSDSLADYPGGVLAIKTFLLACKSLA